MLPLKLSLETGDAFRLRAEIIEQAARVFAPDLLIVDKEPLGLRGELTQTLRMLKERGTRLVLGLRDVLDDAEALDRNGTARASTRPSPTSTTRSGSMAARTSTTRLWG